MVSILIKIKEYFKNECICSLLGLSSLVWIDIDHVIFKTAYLHHFAFVLFIFFFGLGLIIFETKS